MSLTTDEREYLLPVYEDSHCSQDGKKSTQDLKKHNKYSDACRSPPQAAADPTNDIASAPKNIAQGNIHDIPATVRMASLFLHLGSLLAVGMLRQDFAKEVVCASKLGVGMLWAAGTVVWFNVLALTVDLITFWQDSRHVLALFRMCFVSLLAIFISAGLSPANTYDHCAGHGAFKTCTLLESCG